MKNILSILLSMFVCLSVIGCASAQKVEKESHIVCDHLYSTSTPVGYVDVFYSDLEKRMEYIGLVHVHSFRGRLFMKEFTIDRNEYILFVEVSVVSNVDEWNVLTQVPYFIISLKKRHWLGVNYKCVNPAYLSNLYYAKTISDMVNGSALFSKKENWVEELK